MISVLIAEDQSMIRAAFAALLNAQPDMGVCAAVADGAAAVEEANRLRPDVVLMDIRMPRKDGIAATREIRAGRDPKVLILTTFKEERLVLDALDAGANGFLLKDAEPAVLLSAVRRIAAGEGYLDPSITPMVLRHVKAAPQEPAAIPGFTTRESEVLGLVCEGLGNREIADRIFVAESTVKTHVKSLLGKTGTRDRIGLVIWAARRGFL